MFIADATTTASVTATVVTLDGVTTVLTAFIFVCLAMPTLVKHRPQYYAALACVAGLILLHMLSLMFSSFATFLGVATAFLQLMAFLLLVLCVGGLTVKELAGDMARAYEVMRRGETEKELIIPIGDQSGGPRRSKGGEEPPRKVYKIDVDDEDDQIPLS